MDVCLVGTWAKVPNCNDSLEMTQNAFLSRDNITAIPADRDYLGEFREQHPQVKAALVDGIDEFDNLYFEVGEAEALCMDPQQRMLMQGVVHALEDAGIPLELVSLANAAVYTAAWAYDYKDLLPPDQYMATGNSASVMCGRITYFLNSRGAAVGIETACSSSLVAFHLARQAIQSGETKLAIVCGANHVGARSFYSVYNSHMVSPNGRLATFDRSANGFVRAESFAVAILCSREFAEQHSLQILCNCLGSACNSDGRTTSLTAPNPIAQYEVQIEAMKDFESARVQAVTCHGTGTKLGDQVELTAIAKSFPADVRLLGPKSSLGHGEGAAGLVGVFQSLIAMRNRVLPAQLHLELPTELVGDKSIAFVAEEVELDTIAISSYGFGGTNACAIISKTHVEELHVEGKCDIKVLFLSAKCKESLSELLNDYTEFLETSDSSLEDILYTTNVRRTKYEVRAAIFADSREEFVHKLQQKNFIACHEDIEEGGTFEIELGEGNEKLWLLRMLYEANATYKSALDKYCGIAEEHGFTEARPTLFFPFKLTLTPLTYNVARLITALATFEVLQEYKSTPSFLHGKGIGHIFCLAVAKVISFEDAVTLIKCVVANGNIESAFQGIILNNSNISIRYGTASSKRVQLKDVVAEIKKTNPCSNLMTFRINGHEITETDPVVKLQEIVSHLFVAGFDVQPKFSGNNIKIPNYPFLKRRFWPEISKPSRTEKTEENVNSSSRASKEEVATKVKEVVQKFLHIESDESSLLETGEIDSLTSIEMIEAIGSAVRVQMPFDVLDTCSTVSTLSAFIYEKLERGEIITPSNGTTEEKNSRDRAIVASVIASDFKFAGVENEDEFWDALLTSKTMTGTMTEERTKQTGAFTELPVGLLKQDVSFFDNAFFAVPKDEAEFLDPQHRHLLHAAYNALEKSGMTSIPDADLFLAISAHSEYRTIAETQVESLDERLWMGTSHSMAAGRLAALLGIRGRALVVDTTCASVASALEMALQSLRRGRKYAVVATSQLIQSSRWLQSLETLLPKDSTNSFSIEASGFCRSDGVGVVILKAEEENDVANVIISAAISQHSGAVVTPVASAIAQLLEQAGHVDYVEGHGTATVAGDSAEVMAYQNISQPFVMSSSKAQFGHCEVASGLMQLLKTAALMNYSKIPSIVHNYLPNEHIRSNANLRLPFVGEETDVKKCAIVSFGITGTKSVVITENKKTSDMARIASAYFLPLSAKTQDALKTAIAQLCEMLSDTSEALCDIALALQKQKSHHKWRVAVVAGNHEDAVEELKRKMNQGDGDKNTSWFACLDVLSINYPSFIGAIPAFEHHYSTCCTRIRFEPLSDLKSFYHQFAATYALMKVIIDHTVVNTLAVTSYSSLAVIAALEAAPAHYINDLVHAFNANDIRQMKITARDIDLQITSGVEVFDFKGQKVTSARQIVESALEEGFKNVNSFPEGTIFFSKITPESDCTLIRSYNDYVHYLSYNYVRGVHLDMKKIFGSPTKSVTLPEYPFNYKSFWLPIKTTQTSVPPLHGIASPNNSKYIFELNSEDWKHVRNHVIDAQVILPGATSLRLIYDMHGRKPTTIAMIDFLAKVMPKETPMVFEQRNNDETFILGNEEQDAVSYKILPQQLVHPIELQKVSTNPHHAEEVYHRFSMSQLTYRNEFQMIHSIRCALRKGEAEFVTIDNLDILIDGTLQAIVMGYLLENSDDRSPFVPLSIDKVTVISSNLARKQLKCSYTFTASDIFINGSATVYDESQNILLHVENASFKKLVTSKASEAKPRITAFSKKKTKHDDAAKSALLFNTLVNASYYRLQSKKLLTTWFEENYGWSEVDESSGLFDLGLTSLQAIKLRNVIKLSYPNASSTCVFDYPNINDLSDYLASLSGAVGTEVVDEGEDCASEDEDQPPTRISDRPVGVMAAACRLPGGVSDAADLWQLLKIGKNTSSRIPANRIQSRDSLIRGNKYGNPVEGGNFITQDVSLFDAAFFKISRSEAELIDPQQRILLECVQECLENSGVTDASDVGVFVGLMEKEYQDMVESSSILSMLGSMAAVIAGRVNYVFGCYGPSVTIDTACSSSLVALEMGVNALFDQRCSRVIVAGVNLILNEKGQGLRTNGKMLSHHGMSLSFDSRASGYGRSDGCVVLMLEIAKPTRRYMSTIKAVNVNHGGRSVSLTAPNGIAHRMLLTTILSKSPAAKVDYWEAHGTGTPLGDPIELNTLSSVLDNVTVGSVKASLGHGEASAGTCGLLKLFLMLTNQYVPSLIHFHVLNKDVSIGTIRLPIIGEDVVLTNAGISSFGVSGTNAAAIAFYDDTTAAPAGPLGKVFILPMSSKNTKSLQELEQAVLEVIPDSSSSLDEISATLANNRNHYSFRSAVVVDRRGNTLTKCTGKPNRTARKDKLLVPIPEQAVSYDILQLLYVRESFEEAKIYSSDHYALLFSLIKLLSRISTYIDVVPKNSAQLVLCLLANDILVLTSENFELAELEEVELLAELERRNIGPHKYLKLFKSRNEQYEKDITGTDIVDAKSLLSFVANIYINGYDLDWSIVYSHPQSIVPLPNCPYNRQAYWFKEKATIVDHYLVGTVHEKTDTAVIMMNFLSELRHPQLFKAVIDVGTIMEIAIETLKVQFDTAFTLQDISTKEVMLTKSSWLKTVVQKTEDSYQVFATIDEQLLFNLTATPFLDTDEEQTCASREFAMPSKLLHLPESPSAIVRISDDVAMIDASGEASPYRTAATALNELVGYAPNPGDTFMELMYNLPNIFYIIRVDDGSLWQFQVLNQEKLVLINLYVVKDAAEVQIQPLNLQKKSTLLSSHESGALIEISLQKIVKEKVTMAFNDVIDSGNEIDEDGLTTGFMELGMDSLAVVDLVNRLNQKYFPEIELTTSDLFDNPNITDLSIKIERLLREKGVDDPIPEAQVHPDIKRTDSKRSLDGRKFSLVPRKRSELDAEAKESEQRVPKKSIAIASSGFEKNQKAITKTPTSDDADNGDAEIFRKVSCAIFDLATETLTNEDIERKGFSELGMDSLSMVDFVNRLNEKYFHDVEISTSDIFDYPTAKELAQYIFRKTTKPDGNPNNSEESPEDKISSSSQREFTNVDAKPPDMDTFCEKESRTATDTLMDQVYFLVDETEEFWKPDLLLTETKTMFEVRTIDGKSLIEFDAGTKWDRGGFEEIFTNDAKILVSFPAFNNSVENIYIALLNFVQGAVKSPIRIEFAVDKTPTAGNSVSRAFLKTVAAEKYPKLSFVWEQRIQRASSTPPKSKIEGNWLITGGVSGIGLEIARFLSTSGAQNLVLVSRRKPDEKARQEFSSWQAKVWTVSVDVTNELAMKRELEALKLNIDGIIHSAGILKDAKIERQNQNTFKEVFAPKAAGFHTLENVADQLHYELKHFIVMSSFTAACGNTGQLNYAVANAYLEQQIVRRREGGKAGCAIQWGNWLDTGMATNTHVQKVLFDLGFLGQRNSEALAYLHLCIEKNPPLVMVANVNWERILHNRPDLPRDLVLTTTSVFEIVELELKSESDDLVSIQQESSTVDAEPTATPLLDDFEVIDNVEVEDAEQLEIQLKQKLSKFLKISISTLRPNVNIMGLGFTSHSLTAFIAELNSIYGIQINIATVYENSAVSAFVDCIWAEYQKQRAAESTRNVEVSQKQQRDVEASGYCPFLGINLFFGGGLSFEQAKAATLKALTHGTGLPSQGEMAVPIVSDSLEALMKNLNNAEQKLAKKCNQQAKTVMMFAGQGSQYPLMGRQLCEVFPSFKNDLLRAFRKCDTYLTGEKPLHDILFDSDNYEMLQKTLYMQPVMFCFGIAAANLWSRFGVKPDFYLGHSVGELVAGVMAGIVSLEDGIKLIVERAKAMETIRGRGALLAVQREATDDVLRNFDVTIATINSPKQVVLAGRRNELDKVLAFVKEQGRQATFVNQNYPFHSSLITESDLVGLRACIREIKFNRASIPIVSNVTGNFIETFSEDYLVRHTVSAVKFVNCVETLEKAGATCWLEAGPSATLVTFVRRILAPAVLPNHTTLQTCKEKDSDSECFVKAALELEQNGCTIDWAAIYGCDPLKESAEADHFSIMLPPTKDAKLAIDEEEVLKDHQLENIIVVAGAFQLFKMNEFVNTNLPKGLYLKLKKVSFRKPWYLAKGRSYQIRWNPNMTVDMVVNEEITCSAQICIAETKDDPELSFVRDETASPVDVGKLYEHLELQGLQYGKHFRVITDMVKTDKACWSNLATSEFAWPLIDGSFHAICEQVYHERPAVYFIPVSIGQVQIDHDFHFDGKLLQAYTFLKTSNEKFLHLDACITHNGRVVVEVMNMVSIVVNVEKASSSSLPVAPALSGSPDESAAPPAVQCAVEPEESSVLLVGFDLVLPFMNFSNGSEIWEKLKIGRLSDTLSERKSTLANVNLIDVDVKSWDPEFFGIRPSESIFIDPQQRLIMTSFARLIHNFAACKLPQNTGVFIGASTQEFAQLVFASNAPASAELTGGVSTSSLAGRVAHWLKVRGPAVVVDTACSSSSTALTMACEALSKGQCDAALVGTVNLILHEMTTECLRKAKMIVDDFCKVFDASANGYKRSEAICTVLLTRSSFETSSLAHIRHWSTGHNGGSSSLFTPNGKSQEALIRKVPFGPTDIEAHCTGTSLGDPIEIGAISRALPSYPLRLTSAKAHVGHAECASGLVSLCIAVLQSTFQYRLPQLHFSCPNPKIDFLDKNFYLPLIGEDVAPSNFVLNNFGFTGTNCCIFVEPQSAKLPSYTDSCVFYPLFFSANKPEHLIRAQRELVEIVTESNLSLTEIAQQSTKFTLDAHRFKSFIIVSYKRKTVWQPTDSFPTDERLQQIVNDANNFCSRSTMGDKGEKFSISVIPRKPAIAFCNKSFWPNELTISAQPKSSLRKDIFFEKKLVPFRKSFAARNLQAHCVGELNGLNKLCIPDLASKDRVFEIIVFPIRDNSKEEFMQLVQLWQLAEVSFVGMVIVCCWRNETTRTEWTGTIRSLASEKALPYKFISFERVDQVYENFHYSEMFECIFYVDNERYFERLSRLEEISFNPLQKRKNALVTGGTRGIGKALIQAMSPENSTILARNRIEGNEADLSKSVEIVDLSVESKLDLCGKYDILIHCAGQVDNALHINMTAEKLNSVYDVKVNGLQICLEHLRADSKIFIASSAACILGSAGQSNYAFANGMMTSIGEKYRKECFTCHWGPWRETGMLSQESHASVRKQIDEGGWKSLSNEDALAVLCLRPPSSGQILVFDGDFDKIVEKNRHLKKFLSNLINPHLMQAEIRQRSKLEEIFRVITGIGDISEKKDVPFMDLGLDSLCLERLRQMVNEEYKIGLTAADVFDNATFASLKQLLSSKATAKKATEENNQIPTKENSDEIAIIGWSGAFSGSTSISSFLSALYEGKNCINVENKIGIIPDLSLFDHEFFKISKEDANRLDPQLRMFLQHAYHALENAGYAGERSNLKCAVFAGAEPSNYGDSQEQDDTMNRLFAKNMNNYLASYTAYALNLKGEAVSVYTACSTALMAMCQGVQCLQNNRADIALFGAASLALADAPELNGMVDSKTTVFSKSGVARPLDKDCDGIVRGSGVGCFVLKRLDRALENNDNVLAVIKAVGVSNDGRSKASFMAPNSNGQIRCMNEALKNISEDVRQQVSYIECHSTGTPLGDQIELTSIQSAYRFKDHLMIGSCKANIGHAFAAAGLASVAKAIGIFQRRSIPPQINFNALIASNEYEKTSKRLLDVVVKATHFDDGLIGVNAFGIGGTNVHVILGPAPPVTQATLKGNELSKANTLIIPISGPTEESCKRQFTQLERYFETNSEVNFDAASVSLQLRKEHFIYRCALVKDECEPPKKLLTGIEQALEDPKVCFFFAPQGAQYANMISKEFFNLETTFAKTLRRLSAATSEFRQGDFLKVLYPNDINGLDLINGSQNSQLAIFMITYAIYRELCEKGVKPHLLAGHSVGEFAAAVASGSLDEGAAIELLYERSALVSQTARARMLIVWGNVPKHNYAVEISAFLATNTNCFTGAAEEITKFESFLNLHSIRYKVIPTTHGFHSSMLDCIMSEFCKICSQIEFREGRIPWISSCNGSLMKTMSMEYCGKHMREPVNLIALVDQLISSEVDIVVEIGPPGVLSSLLRERNSKIKVVQTVGSKKQPRACLSLAIAELWKAGVKVNFSSFYKGNVAFDFNLPRYSYSLDHCWTDCASKSRISQGAFKLYSPVWREVMATGKCMFLGKEPVCDVIVCSRDKELHRPLIDDASTVSKAIYHPTDDLPRCSTLVYLLSPQSTDIHQVYFDVRKLRGRQNFDHFVVVSYNSNENDCLALGPLRNLSISLQKDVSSMFVEATNGVSLTKILSFAQCDSFNYLRFLADGIYQMDFAETIYDVFPPANSAGAVVFGGTGFVGQLFCKLLQQLGYTVISISRSTKELQCDITQFSQVFGVIQRLKNNNFNVSAIINCCGIETSQTLFKSDVDSLKVLSVKTIGNKNILQAVEDLEMTVGLLVMCSSMSAIVPFQGNEDYASANSFVDSLARRPHKYVHRILALSLPAVRGSPMVETSTPALRKLLYHCSISVSELIEVLKTALSGVGNCIICNDHPLTIARECIKLQRNGWTTEELITKELKPADVIREIWAEVLSMNIDQIPDEKSFFSMGGDSLSGLQAVWKISQRLGKTVLIDTLFENPTITQLANAVEKIRNDKIEAAVTINDYNAIPLTNSQTHMYHLAQLHNDGKYNILFQIVLRITSSEFSWKSFNNGLQSLVATQCCLRTRFPADPVAKQEVLSLTECYQNLAVETFDEEAWRNVIEYEKNYNFEIGHDVPFHVRVNASSGEIVVLFNQHHIITDGWSMTILAQSLCQYYKLYTSGKSAEIHAQQNSMPICSLLERSTDIQSLLEDCAAKFKDLTRSSIPSDKHDETAHEESHVKFSTILPKKLARKISTYAEKCSTTYHIVCLAAFLKVVRSYQEENEVMIAFANSGRNESNSDLLGYCMNNVLLVCDLSSNCTLQHAINRTIASLNSSRKYHDVPYFELVRCIANTTNAANISIYFNYRHNLDFPKTEIQGATTRIEQLSINSAFDFSFTIDETALGTQLSVEYNCGKYFESTIKNFVLCYMKALTKFDTLPRNKRLIGVQSDYPRALVSSSLLRYWMRNKDYLALGGAGRVNYETFCTAVENQAVAVDKLYFTRNGSILRADDAVYIDEECPATSVQSIAACSYLGVAYSPAHHAWPLARRKFVQSWTQITSPIVNRKKSWKRRIYCRALPCDLCYIIFTSGSTGDPKGVAMPRRAASSFILSATKQCLLRPKLTVLNSVQHVFDVSVVNIFGTLLNSSTLYYYSKDEYAVDHLDKCNFVFLPSAVFNTSSLSLATRLKLVETLAIGGEPIKNITLDMILNCNTRVLQIYGPTETCVWSTSNWCREEPASNSIIGTPMDNECCELIGGNLIGELFITGSKVARGYLSRHLSISFNGGYKTGDMVGCHKHRLRFVRRKDAQIKIRGIRVDCREIETVICESDSVTAAKVMQIGTQLVAFYCKTSNLNTDLKYLLQSRLPSYAIPDDFIELDKLPLNSSGKIDKHALQALKEMRKTPNREFKAVMINSVEEQVIKLAEDLIGTDVHIEDNFNALGGHSVHAIQLAQQLSGIFGIEIKAHELLQQASLKDFADAIGKRLKNSLKSTDTSIITKLREVKNPKFNIYMPHAIGGTTYPYYNFLQVFPKSVSVYGIEYRTEYPAESVKELAAFYAKAVAAHAGDRKVFLVGHSMGGIISREMVPDLKIWGFEVPFVMMFDSWVLKTNELDVDRIGVFVRVKLAGFLRNYSTAISETKLYLFKSKQLGEAAFKKAVRDNLTEEAGRAMVFNGFDAVCTQPIDTYLIEGDHESCLKIENLKQVQTDILAPFQRWL